MPVLNPRTRLITFRLSDREYRRLRAVCDAHHARSLSDFVRSGVCWILRESNQGLAEIIANAQAAEALAASRSQPEDYEPGDEAVQKLERKMNSLAREVRRLSKLLPDGSPRANASPDGAAYSHERTD